MFMDFKFGKSSGDSQPEETPGETKKQSALVVLLLILVGGFTYIYFFTGLVKPQEAKRVEEPPAASAPQVVKMPLPARENEPAAPAGKAPAKTEAAKTAAAPAVKPAAAPVKPAPAPAPVAKAAPAPAPAPAKPKEAPKKAEAAKPVDKKPAAVAGAEKKGAEKKVAEAKKAATPEKKSAPAKEAAKKPAADTKTKPEAVAAAKHAAPASWSIMVGNYVLEEALSADMGRVRKAGFDPLVKPSVRKKTAMHRLLVAEVTDRATAQATLEKLKRHTSDAFVIEQGGKFAVYAGSYLQNEAASTEKERLKSSGFPVTVKNAEIAIPSQSLSVGPFKNKKTADAALGKLKSAGIKATLLSK